MTNEPIIPLPEPPARVHFVGIGGAGMQGLATILLARGYHVSGSDRADSPALDALRAAGATVSIGHDAAFIGDAALVVTTAAVNEANPEVAAARARGIPAIKRAALLGMLANAKRLIAVAGTHGKSTTSGMIAYMLSELGHDPLFAIGATVRDLGASARDGAGDWAVVEADEYDYSFLQLTPDVAVITNIEHDHPDVFPDEAAYSEAFRQFVAKLRPGGTLIVNADEAACVALAADYAGVTETVGTGEQAQWRIDTEDDVPHLRHGEDYVGALMLAVPGVHNLRNAAMAVAACARVGVPSADALALVAKYRGVGRRFEEVGEVDGVTVIDDYAHHPTEVRATIAAARVRYPSADGRIIAVFQPHTYTRTAMLYRESGDALGAATRALVTDIYAAREPDPGTIRSQDIVKHIPYGRGEYSGSLDQTVARLTAIVEPGDIVLTLGAGDITTVGPRLLGALRARAGGA